MALALLLCAVAGFAAGCGTPAMSSPAAFRLQREDLAAASRALLGVDRSVVAEVAATKRAWPLVVNGLPSAPGASALSRITTAARSSEQIKLPGLFEEARAVSLTGPAAGLAGLFRSYIALASRGWKLIVAAIGEIEHGSPSSARFARENVGLYIESIYDGHFTLAQIGKTLLAGYRKLGGPAAFAGSLTQQTVRRLTEAYSEAADRLHPHSGVRLGS